MKRIFETNAVFAVFAAMTLAAMVIVIGAVMCVVSIVTDLRPTDIQRICLVITMLMGGVIGAVLFVNDTND